MKKILIIIFYIALSGCVSSKLDDAAKSLARVVKNACDSGRVERIQEIEGTINSSLVVGVVRRKIRSEVRVVEISSHPRSRR